MAYSTLYLRKVRDALIHYKRYGGPVPGREQSWARVIDSLEVYTAYEFDDLSEMQLRNDAEALRQFAIGMSPSRRRKTREIASRLLEAVIELLTHPEVSLLPKPGAEIDLSLGLQLSNFLTTKLQARGLAFNLAGHARAFAGASYARRSLLTRFYGRDDIRDCAVLSHLFLEIGDEPKGLVRAVDLVVTTPVVNERGGTETIRETWSGALVFQTQNLAYLLATEAASGRTTQFLWQLHSGPKAHAGQHGTLIDLRAQGEDTPLGVSTLPPPVDVLKNPRAALETADASATLDGTALLAETAEDYWRARATDDIAIIAADLDPSRSFRSRIGGLLGPRGSTSELAGPTDVAALSAQLTTALRGGFFSRLVPLLEAGARLDSTDPDTGLNALHVLAGRGYRDGIRMALRYPERCNFAARDGRGRLTSYHAEVYADDPALARLLRFHERRAGVN